MGRMAEARRLRDTVEVCMFDQYGTLVDMQEGLTEAIRPYLREKGWLGDPGRLVTWWRRAHFENSMIDALLGGEHTPYRAIGELSLDATLERAGIPHTPEEVRRLVAQIERLRPFPEVPAALERLRPRYRLAILSNGDPDMLEAARAHHGLRVDHVLSVVVANAFKPHRATYLRAAELVGAAPEAILFVASHVFDCVGAKAAGLRAAFVNRRGRPFGRWPYQPDLVVPDMTALADALA
jgi:2-haloacid dehalogenase